MLKELKNKTDEAIRARQIIGFLVLIISFSAFLIFLFFYILIFAVGHGGELNWSLYIAIPSFCLFLLAVFYERAITKERKRRIEDEELEETKKKIHFGWLEIIVVTVITAIISTFSFLFLARILSIIIIVISVICGVIFLLVFSPKLREKK